MTGTISEPLAGGPAPRDASNPPRGRGYAPRAVPQERGLSEHGAYPPHAVDLTHLSERTGVRPPNPERAQSNFARLVSHVAELYCMGDSSSVDAYEAQELAMSVAYALGIENATPEEAMRVLDVDDPVALWHNCLSALDARMDAALATRQEIIAIMPPIPNVSLRDTLASLGELRYCYDIYLAAHEVPCGIDYQLSEPIDPYLMGIDYIEKWLAQLLKETRWIARFSAESCISVLEASCPDYRGLHVNLYDLLRPHEGKLVLSNQT